MTDPSTSLKSELDFLERWQPLPEHRDNPLFRQQVHNEFDDPKKRETELLERLRQVLQHCEAEVPYYRDLFARAGFRAADVSTLDDLARVPVLSRYNVVRDFDRLQPAGAPAVGKGAFISRTSGSTGLPVRVLQTRNDLYIFATLWLRQARWFRFELEGRMARIRLPKHLFRQADGSMNPDGKCITRPHWAYAGEFFHTGDEVHFNLNNSREAQLDWLKRYKPHYLMTFPPLLEELALLNGGNELPQLKSVVAVASMLTSAMRGRIEQSFKVPVNQSYGLNEAGNIATRCGAGRYHVHSEHVLVELLGADDQPARSGETGRIVITPLTNPVMPLLRYDTGDMARVVEGPCPCGRTLPSFGAVLGRFIRFAGTPEGTRPRLNGLLAEIARLPNEVFTNIRQYQVYQGPDEDWEIRVKVVGPMNPEFSSALKAAWRNIHHDLEDRRLAIVEVDEIEATPSGKQLDFLSAFHELESDFGHDAAAQASANPRP
jgi:phenylacetate-CoA ligase